MTDTWLPIFDAAGSWPTDAAAVHTDGYRVAAGYGGSQAWKAEGIGRIRSYRGAGIATAAMFESAGTEPVNSPGDGIAHGKAARAAWRALGMPDHAAIAYAVDRNVTIAQIQGPVATYFENVKKADGTTPIAYLEADGADWLFARGLIAGCFTPAAYAWNNPPILYTPANAPAHVLWTQEHNGVSLRGGNVDIGHIRATAPIWWLDTQVAPHPAPSPVVAPPVVDHRPGSRELRVSSPMMHGYDVGYAQTKAGMAGTAVDRIYGPHTAEYVKTFQKAHKLTQDGIVGPLTWKAMGVGA